MEWFHKKVSDIIDVLCMVSFIAWCIYFSTLYIDSPIVGVIVGGAIIVYYFMHRDPVKF